VTYIDIHIINEVFISCWLHCFPMVIGCIEIEIWRPGPLVDWWYHTWNFSHGHFLLWCQIWQRYVE